MEHGLPDADISVQAAISVAAIRPVGKAMRLGRIGQELPDRKTRGQQPWVFRLEVDFPEVGHVAARGTAAGENLSLRLVFSGVSAADEASARIGELEESLRETGLHTVLVSCATSATLRSSGPSLRSTSAAGTPGGADLHEGGVDVIV